MTSRTNTARTIGGSLLAVALAGTVLTPLIASADTAPAGRVKASTASSPVLRIVSPLGDAAVARGEGRPGRGSTAGSGFAFNVEIATRDDVAVAVNESPNIRHPEALGRPNPDFPGFTATTDIDLITPDGGTIKAGTNLAALFNVAGSDDTPGPGVTVWAGWHVLESIPTGVQKFTLHTSVVDAAGRRSADQVTVDVDDVRARSGQGLTPAPAVLTGDGVDDLDGPEVNLLAPRVPTRVATGPDFAPPPGSGALFFLQVNSTDRAGHGIGVSENGQGTGLVRDPTQIAVGGANRNFPGLAVTFDVPLRQPNGNLVPAGQNLAPLFDVAGSELDPDHIVRTVADWVVGGSLELPDGKNSVVITASVTDAAGRTGSDKVTVGVSTTRDGQQLTPQPPQAVAPPAAGTRFTATLDGRQEVSASGQLGAGDPDGTGTFDAILSASRDTICYRLRVDGIAAGSRFHVHQGAAGQNGPIVIPFFETNQQPRPDACVKVDPPVAAGIIASDFYVNVHNQDFPAGAIRGQLQSD